MNPFKPTNFDKLESDIESQMPERETEMPDFRHASDCDFVIDGEEDCNCKEQNINGDEMQRVWRTASHSKIDGYFVWDILEVVGFVEDRPFLTKHFTECRDGSYILIQCYHFWTVESAGKYLHNPGMVGYQTIEIIGE